MNLTASLKKGELRILILSLFLSSLRGSRFWPLNAQATSIFSILWIEVAFWVLLAVLIIRFLRREGNWEGFVSQWRNEKALLVFLAFASLSIFWSISPGTSLYRIIILLITSFAGAYIGSQYNLRQILNILFWFGAIVVIFSFGLALWVPELGVASGFPYYGSWRGIYWHRNHLGAIIALLNAIFLLRVFVHHQERSRFWLLDMVFYALSLCLAYLARSVAGYILTIVLHFSIIVAAVWLKVSPRLQPKHYYVILGGAILGLVLIFSNLDFVFGLFNRNASLTGRTPLWEYLLKDVVMRSPFIGYGFGALWTIPSFRIGLQIIVHWAFQILIGDNGFLDILLHLGVIGLLLFLGVWFRAWALTIKYGLEKRTLLDFFPLIYMIFTLFANISFSLFLEVESFVWLALIAVLFTVIRGDTSLRIHGI